MPPSFHPYMAGNTSTNREKTALKKIIVLLIGVFLMFSLFSCAGKKEADRKTDADVQGKVLATVNGVPITEYDVNLSLKRVVHGEAVPPEAAENALQALVRNELVYQQSLELGLDNNPEYRRKVSEVEAQLRDYKRKEMSALFREYVRAKADVTDSEARDHFEKNSNRIRTRVHLGQIYYRGEESRIAEDYKELKSGKSFEKVASKRFPNLPKGMKAPWDLGYLHWSQIPPFWQDSVDRLKPGQVSEILRGPNERFWVIQLIDRKVDPGITFATEKENIVEVLRKRKADELSEAMLGRMRSKSKITSPKQTAGEATK
jgi:hypothetical protein